MIRSELNDGGAMARKRASGNGDEPRRRGADKQPRQKRGVVYTAESILAIAEQLDLLGQMFRRSVESMRALEIESAKAAYIGGTIDGVKSMINLATSIDADVQGQAMTKRLDGLRGEDGRVTG